MRTAVIYSNKLEWHDKKTISYYPEITQINWSNDRNKQEWLTKLHK